MQRAATRITARHADVREMPRPSPYSRTPRRCRTRVDGDLRDLPRAELHVLDTGHFALEDKLDEIAHLILDFLGRKVK